MVRRLSLASMAVAVALVPGAAFANVYATNLGQSSGSLNWGAGQTVTLSYLLNENADTDVTLRILDSGNNAIRTVSLGAQTKGVQNWVWDGKDDSNNFVNGNFSFSVQAADNGYGSWTMISTNSTLNNIGFTRGVAVNKNPDSPYFGRIYVAQGNNVATVAGRPMIDGIYMLNSDFSDVVGSPSSGGIDWVSGGTFSPFKVEVGPDDQVYIADWSDQTSGIYVADPNIASASYIFQGASARNESGLTDTHGSVSDIVVTGTGSDRKIYTIDEDFIVGSSLTSAGSVLRYDIGNAATFAGAPSAVVYDDGAAGNININFFNSLALDNNGNFWATQSRAAGTDVASLWQFDASGSVIWKSLTSLGSPDPLRGIQGMAYDPVNNILALVTNRNQTTPFAASGLIIIFDANTKTIITSFGFVGSATGATTNGDVSFDAVGNLYVGNRSAERVHVWSPANGANSYTTKSLAPLGAINVVPEPGSMVALATGLAGMAGMVIRRKK